MCLLFDDPGGLPSTNLDPNSSRARRFYGRVSTKIKLDKTQASEELCAPDLDPEPLILGPRRPYEVYGGSTSFYLLIPPDLFKIEASILN